jgi:L-ascorbate metabolism protein UlaG (beta-lactamase superfamily)
MHMTPEQALQVFSILEARAAVAMHFGTFSLADDSENEPVRRLRQALKEGEAFWVLAEGEGRDFPESFHA